LTLRELAQAAIDVSDNTAANLLLARVGGPAGLTAFFRRFGDATSRLDRDEPMLNMNTLGDPRDTTTPRTMAQLVEAIMTRALSTPSRELLKSWLVATKTGTARLRAGLPPQFRVGDKTGTGNRGACNDVAMVWPTSGAPAWIIASYLSDSTASLDEMNAAHAEIARIVTSRFGAV
jgi:beta-lactamase class A